MRHRPAPIRRAKRIAKRIRSLALIAATIILAGSVIYASINNRRSKSAAETGADACSLTKVVMPESTPGIMLEYTGFTVNFNPEMHVPNYVAWELTAQETKGDLPRHNKFSPDKKVPGCPTLNDYRRSGFDRGHMAPAGDMKWDSQAMKDCFLLTNMCPQTSRLNSGRWNDLENKCRTWAARDSALIIICGPVLTDRLTRTIGDTKVVVPQRFFKVIYAPYAKEPAMLAFVFSNTALPESLKDASRSVDEVEELTGLDFFAELPDNIENSLESKNAFHQWQRSHRH